MSDIRVAVLADAAGARADEIAVMASVDRPGLAACRNSPRQAATT